MCGRSIEYMVQLKLFGENTFVIEVSQQFKMWDRIGQNKKYVLVWLMNSCYLENNKGIFSEYWLLR